MFEEFDAEFDRGFFDADFDWEDPEIRGLHIEMRDSGGGRPEVDVRRLGPARRRPPVEEIPPEGGEGGVIDPIKGTIETDATKIERPDEVDLVIRVPGVDEKDIAIRRAGHTIEIIARRSDGRAYFATFELPPDADPESRSFEIEGGVLTVTIPRRKDVRNL